MVAIDMVNASSVMRSMDLDSQLVVVSPTLMKAALAQCAALGQVLVIGRCNLCL